MTSESLKAVKQLIHTAHQQREEISQQLTAARDERRIAEERFRDWDGGFLLKRIFKKQFAERQSRLETENAKVEELEEQLRLSTIETHIEVAKEQADFYFRLRDEFAAMCECAAIWDIKSHQATDRARERTTAAQRIDRHKVKFGLSTCDLIQWEQKIPHLQNSKGGDLYLYPGFVLYRAAKEAFSVIDYHELSGRAEMKSFIEDEAVPADSEVIGQTWAKSNKDGSRDKRFADNYQIPVARYGQVTLKSNNGLWEEFQFSSPHRMLTFLNALNAFTASFER